MRSVPLSPLREQELREQAKQRRNVPDARKYQPYGGEKDTYVSPNFGDGGWHDTPGTRRDMRLLIPRNDRILVELEPMKAPSSVIVAPQSARPESLTRIGTVLKCGPGKWIAGEWWHFYQPKPHWEWIPGHRQQMTATPGMRVVIGKWTDLEGWDSGYEHETPNIVLCQEADIRVILQ